jgi:hypothetical protein
LFSLLAQRRPRDDGSGMKAMVAPLVTALCATFCFSCKPKAAGGGEPPESSKQEDQVAPLGDPTKPESYLGLDEATAARLADSGGVPWRIIEVDGEPRPATMDLRPERMNFAMAKGKVIRVTQG